MNFYYENSNGRKIDLNKPPFLGVKSNDLFSYEWDYITQGQSVQKIVKFEKYMKQKKFQVLISGLDDHDYRSHLEQFLQLTDVDINNLRMGKLWVDNYYLEGYIFASTKPKRYVGTNKTLIELTLICEKGNWQSEETYHFRIGHNDSDEHDEYTGYGITYPYEYPYDYSAAFSNNTIVNESYLDTDFELTFYGANSHPHVVIGGETYDVGYALGADDYMIINSKRKIVQVVKQNGTIVNVFKYRHTDYNIFEKIKSGGNLVIKDNNVAIDLKLFYERSEPKWTEAKWT